MKVLVTGAAWFYRLYAFEISINDLLDSTHASKPRNKLIAQVFFDIWPFCNH